MKPEVSIVIPAYNENERLGGPLQKILQYVSDTKLNAEVIVVDDGSSDSTARIAEQTFAAMPAVPAQAIRYEKNRGKGFAVRTGLQAANADVAIFTDADLSTPIEELTKLTAPIIAGDVDVAFGSRA